MKTTTTRERERKSKTVSDRGEDREISSALRSGGLGKYRAEARSAKKLRRGRRRLSSRTNTQNASWGERDFRPSLRGIETEIAG